MKKEASLILTLFVMMMTPFAFRQVDKGIGVQPVDRSVASLKENECLKMISGFLTNVKDELNPVLVKLGAQTFEVKMRILKSLGKLNIHSNSLKERYAKLLNATLEKKILTKEELDEVIKELNHEKTWVYIGKDSKVYVDLELDFAEVRDVQNMLNDLGLSESLQKTILEMELKKGEFNTLLDFHGSMTEEQASTFITYVHFVRSLHETERKEALKFLPELLAGGSPESKYVKTFQKYQKKISNFVEKEKNKLLEEFRKNQFVNKWTDEMIEQKAFEESIAKGKIYERLTFGCKSKSINVERIAANKKFITTMISLEMVIGGSSFVYANREDPKNLEWFKRFAFDTTMDIGNILISSHITTNPRDEGIAKALKYYFTTATLNIGPAITYSKMFSPSDKVKEEAFKELMASPEYKEKMAELISYLETNEEQIRLKELMLPAMESRNSKLPENEEAKELLSKALANALYAKNKGDWIHTGDVGLDRYVFNEIWGIQSAARNITVNLLMYNALCMGELNPRKAYALALTYFIVNKGIFDPIYNISRKKAINQ